MTNQESDKEVTSTCCQLFTVTPGFGPKIQAKGDIAVLRAMMKREHALGVDAFIKHPEGSIERVEELKPKYPTCSTCKHWHEWSSTCKLHKKIGSGMGIYIYPLILLTSGTFGCTHHKSKT